MQTAIMRGMSEKIVECELTLLTRQTIDAAAETDRAISSDMRQAARLDREWASDEHDWENRVPAFQITRIQSHS